MSSRREAVLAAIEALLQTALPGVDVGRNREFATRPGAAGNVVMMDGDPGDPEVDLSPATYTYQHRVPLMFAAPDRGALEALFAAVRAAVEADRFLGGLCSYLEAEAPQTDSLDSSEAEPYAEAGAALIAEYSTPSPL
jgi:hypothetical protein